MPAGIPRTEPLNKCRRQACDERVKEYRSKYCSRSCMQIDRRGGIAPEPKPVVRKPQVWAEVGSDAFEYWWMDKNLPREGLTALAATRKFSHDKKAVPAPNWIDLR